MFQSKRFLLIIPLFGMLAACNPIEEIQSWMDRRKEIKERKEYVKQAIVNTVAIDTIGAEIEWDFDRHKEMCLHDHCPRDLMQIILDTMRVLEKEKFNRFKELYESSPEGNNFDHGAIKSAGYNDVRGIYFGFMSFYLERCDLIENFSIYMQSGKEGLLASIRKSMQTVPEGMRLSPEEIDSTDWLAMTSLFKRDKVISFYSEKYGIKQ